MGQKFIQQGLRMLSKDMNVTRIANAFLDYNFEYIWLQFGELTKSEMVEYVLGIYTLMEASMTVTTNE